MKILYCIYDHPENPWVGGGGAVRSAEICRRLAARHEVTMICGMYPGARARREGNLTVGFAGTGRDNYVLSTFAYAFCASSVIKRRGRDFDVVVEDFAPYNPLFSFMYRPDAVLQMHQSEGLTHLRKFLVLGIPFFLSERYYHRFFRSVCLVSGLVGKRLGVGGRVEVIPNGIDPALLEAEPRGEDHMLFLGRMHIDSKGLDILRRAYDHTKARPGLLLAGGGKDEDRVRKMFGPLLADGTANMPGHLSGQAKADALRDSIALVFPSRYEAQGISVLEAAACGKPVIVSNIPELAYAVDGGFGVSFKSRDPRDLARVIDMVAGDRELRKRLSARAREFARDFTWDRIAERFESFLKGAAEAGGQG